MTGGHNGIDIVRPHGEPIYCVEGGLVVEALGKETGYGTHVKVFGDSGYEWTYGHLSAIHKDCVLGKRIERGATIGKMGNTGFTVSGSTAFWKDNPYAGTHLHLGRRLVKLWDGVGQWSVTYLSHTDSPIRGVIQDYSNGTFGAVAITAEDFGAEPEKPPSPVKDYTDTIAIVQKEAEKQTDSTIKAAFLQTVQKLLAQLVKLVS